MKGVLVPLATTRRTGLVEQVITQLREAIVAGEYPLGTRLPAEPELTRVLGVSRNTVREAVRALCHAGLVDVRQGDGTYVSATSELSGAVRRLPDDELRDVLEVRRMIEVEAARFAASRRTDSELTLLREAMRARDRAAQEQNLDEFVATDAEFHRQIVLASRNAVLIDLYRGLEEGIQASVATGAVADIAGDHTTSHSGIFDAIVAGDPDRAAAEAGGFLTEMLRRHT